MPVVSQSGLFNFVAFTDAGLPAAAYRVYTYTPSTTTHTTAYTDSAGTVAHTYTSDGAGGQYIATNSRGELPAPLFFQAGGADVVLKTNSGVSVWTRRATSNSDVALNSITTLRADFEAATGAGLVGFDISETYPSGTVGAKLSESASIYDSLPDGFNAANDATAYIQLALDSGADVVDFFGLSLKCDAVTVPAGVWAKNVNFTKYTNAAGNIVLVNSGCTVTGKITGSGLTNAVQRGVYPATSAVTDVSLNLEVSNLPYGVQAAPVATASSLTYPRRWSGYIYAHDILGAVGVSEGYGLLLESAQSCTFVVKSKNIRRHAVYLSAGACDNVIDADIDGCGNYAAQINTVSPQAASQRNRLTVRARNLTTDVATQSGALAVVGRSHYNVCAVDCEGNSTTFEAIRIEGASSGVQADHPKGNQIINGTITGQFTGGDVVRMLNADGTHVRGNVIDAYATSSAIATRRTGTNLSLHGGYIDGNTINCQGQAIKGVYNEINTVPSYIGPNDISNNGGAARVDDQTGGYRMGYSRRVQFSGTTASVSAASVADTTVTFPLSREVAVTGRRAGVNITGSSVSFTNPHAIIRVQAPSATTLSFRLYNAAGGAQTFDYEGWVEGD